MIVTIWVVTFKTLHFFARISPAGHELWVQLVLFVLVDHILVEKGEPFARVTETAYSSKSLPVATICVEAEAQEERNSISIGAPIVKTSH